MRPALPWHPNQTKVPDIISHQRTINQNHSEMSHCEPHPLGWLESKIQVLINSDKDVEKLKPSHTVGENVKWCNHFEKQFGISLVVQWLRISLSVQGPWVRSRVGEDPTCCRATEPTCHNYWACALEPTSHNYWAHVPQLLKPAHLERALCNKRSHRNEKPAGTTTKSNPWSLKLEKARVQQWRPSAAKNK